MKQIILIIIVLSAIGWIAGCKKGECPKQKDAKTDMVAIAKKDKADSLVYDSLYEAAIKNDSLRLPIANQ